MAVPGERATIDGDGEPRIPVFTVVKNGAVLKNIFVVDKPPPPSPPPPPGGPARPRPAVGAETAAAGREGRGEMLIVGRHPDCHIMLTHPSISRFHLQIHSDPSRRKLSVVDLSSVHGTWVSEKKIEPGVVVELSEGDTLRVGGSSRVYRLHWVPLSRAYDFENPFVSALDASGADEEKEEEDLVIDEGKVEEEREDEDSLEIGCEDDDDLESSFVLEDEEHVHQDSFQDENKGIHSPESLLKGVEALALDDCEELPAKNQSPSQLPIPENPYASTYGEKETDAGLGSKAVDDFFMLAEYLQTEPMDASSPFRILFDIDNQKFNEEKWSTEVGIATKLVSANKGSIRSAHDDLENCLVAEAFEDNRKFNEEKWSTEVGIATELVSANEGSIRSVHDDLENCVVAEAFVDNRKFNEEKWSTEVGIATELVSADEGSMRSAHDDLENCSVAEACEDNQKFNEEKWSTEVGIATELVSADEGSMRSAHDDLGNCLVAEACEDNQKFNEEKWSTEVGIATELVSADEGSMRSAHDDLENCLVAEACEDNQKFNEEKWSAEVSIATELVSADEGSIRSAHDDLENCSVAEACGDNQKFNEEKWSTEVGNATELVSADEGSIRSADDDLENCSVAEAFGDSQKFNEERWSTEVGIATELVSADEGSIRSADDDLENCSVAEAFGDSQKFNEERWSTEVGIATELVSADEGSMRSAHDDLENCSVAEACGDNQKFNEEKWSTEVGNATELVSADEGSIRSADDDLENCSVAEAFGDSQKFNEERWSTEVGIATELVSADEGSIRSAHDDLENCLVAEDFEDNWKFNEEKWSMEVGIAAELVSADEGSIKSAHDDLENCSVAESCGDNQKFNEEKWSTEVGNATELVSADEGSIRSADDDLENCSVAEAFGDSQKFNEERWSTEVGIATELVSADEGSIRSAHDDLENCLVAEDFEDNWKFNEEKWSMEVGIAAELVSADEGSIKSAHDDLENCSVAEAFEGNQKFNEEKWSMEVGNATELVSADEGSIRSAHDDPENCLVAETFEESKCTLSIDSEVGDSLSHPSAPYYPCSSCPEIFSEMENQQLGQEDNAEQPFNTLGSLSSGGKTRTLRKERKPFTSMLIDDARPRKGCSSAVEIREESQNQVTHIDNQEDGDTLSHHFAKSLADTITSSESDREILLETTDQHLNDENQRPQYGSVTGRLSESGKESSPLGQSCTKSKCSSIWSRRGKPSTVLQLQTNRRKGMTKSAATASRNKQHSQDNNENQLSAVPFLSLDGEEEEIFTPDKENLTPNTRLLKSLKKISKMEVAEARPAESFRRSSSKLSPMANICNEEDVFYSDKENQTPEGLRGQKMARRASGSSSRLRRELGLKQGAERSAFKSLSVRSGSQSTASGGAMKSGLSVDGVRSLGRKVSALSANKSYGEPNKSWIMVVDTTSFLNKESMKSLQLLQGLKGTQLFIPRIVIRELDCLKRRASVFRRTTEVSSALEWIEDTMVNLKWWIHVQRSMEEGMSVAPTPPATPRCIFGDVSETFSAATPGGSVMDIISPTTEDHVLESALFYRKTNPNGQLVLLSNDISLKIKAMAEGILCETAQEFRESLVNPFSDRFLWADSSPRGQTWSCLDDVVLKEKYYSRPSKKSARGEGLSGLKLILLHNSQYGQQIRSVG